MTRLHEEHVVFLVDDRSDAREQPFAQAVLGHFADELSIRVHWLTKPRTSHKMTRTLKESGTHAL